MECANEDNPNDELKRCLAFRPRAVLAARAAEKEDESSGDFLP